MDNYIIKLDELMIKYLNYISKNNNNSAKYVLGLSILMVKPKNNIIEFKDIADKVIDIYFRNIFKYDLIEHNKNQPSKVQQDMKEYFETYGYTSELSSIDRNNIRNLIIKNKSNGFFKYVLPCFTGARKNDKGEYIYPNIGENEFFYYDLYKEELILKQDFLNLINEKYYLIKYLTIEYYRKYLEKKNPNIKNINEILIEY